MSTGEKVGAFIICALFAYYFLVSATKNRRNQFIGDFFEGVAEDEAESLLL